ncbi:MAG: LPXTG-motif cell wall anchor domain protein, partial [Thermomicrobiales bacterium]|nr:LPXTG-motif cell wall anchor domain protein [Thermomicrobiales bacterium]
MNGADDGVIQFDTVPAGRYRLQEVTAPTGYQPADSQAVDVGAGAPTEVTVEYQQARGRPGRLIILVADEEGDPVPQTCFDVQGPVELSEVCDRQDDGQLNVPDLPAGEYTVTQTRTAEGFTPADETSVVVPEDDTIELPLVNARAETEGQEQAQDEEGEEIAPVDEGGVTVSIQSEDGAPLPGACVALEDGSSVTSVCDDEADDESGDAGEIEIGAVAPGDYTLTVTPPDGFDAPSPTTIQVAAGPSTPVDIVLSAVETAPENGSVAILAEELEEGGGRLPQACYTVEMPPGGQAFGPFCDEDGDGEVTVQGVTPGPIAVVESTPPPDAEPAEPARQEVEIVAGEEAQVIFRHAPPTQEQEQATEGTVEVRVTNAAGEPVAACIELVDGEPEAIVVCDDDEDDTDDRPGQVRIEQVPASPYSVALTELPEGVPDPGPQNIDVEAGEIRTVDFTVASGPGTLVIFVENEDGERIGGACFTLEGETGAETLSDVCDQGDDGRLNVPDLPSGDYTIVQTRAGGNRELAPEQSVTIEPGQTVEVTLLNPREPEAETPTPQPAATSTATPEAAATATPESTPEPVATAEQPVETGLLSVASLGPDGSPLGDSCYVLTDAANVPVAEVCDNDASDFDSAPGVIAFGGIPAGPYTLTQTAATEGFSPAAPVAFEHGVDDTVVEMVSQPVTEETGVVELVTFGDDGNPIADQCYTLVGVTGSFGPFCDNGEGDSAADPGVLTVERLPVGTYEAVLETAVEDADVEQAQQAKPRRSVSVRRGDRPTRTIFNIRAQQQQRGDILIRVRDEDGSYLEGACFGLIPDGETAPSAEVCDNRSGDENSATGRILMTNIRAGRYALTQNTAPTGYTTVADQSVRIAAGSVREVAVTNQSEPERTATLDVETTDGEDNALPGACYAITRGNSTSEGCDGNDDGITRFADIPSGSYVVRQIQPPAGGYTTAGSTATRLDPGQTATVTVVNEARPGSLVVRKTDEAGQLLVGACFALRSGERAVYSICDNDASDANTTVGIMLLGTVAPGTYTVRETQPPIGYLSAADQEVTISANQRSQISVVNAPAPVPQRTGDLRVFKVDTDGRALAGSCFALIDGEGQVLAPRCDADDGADNGVILIEGIAPGEYGLRETRRPSADYLPTSDVLVEIVVDQTVDVEVVNQLRAGRILIRKTDPNGVPLAGACFDLVEDDAGASCTDENGELLFAALAPGVYRVMETEAPAGYLVAPAINPITVRPGSTATIDVVDQPAPPPPDSGSIQVRKFVCPVAEGGGGVVFVDSSDPDGGGLARTAGCDIGDAAFVLDGPSGPIEFRTGTGGRYQTTLDAGDYVLTELSSGESEPLTVRVNTLTTVVVVNYVEPEGEQPAAVDVVKYTCAPGFQGRVWLDFAEACLDDGNLTNNVGYRLSGAVSARRVTGDTGSGGATRFDGLPPGDYRLREETPLGTVAVYAFCGLDPASPNGRGVGDAVNLRLGAGQTVTCHWFNVPEDLAGDTGAITVYKYACPVTVPPAGFDWYGRCDPQGQGVEF